MQLTKEMVATLNYKLSDDDGNIIDQSDDGTFSYLHGTSNIIPGLETALEGKQVGAQLTVVVEPAEAYGERDLEKIMKISREMFPQELDIAPGMRFQSQTQQGEPLSVVVTAVDIDEVVVDANHPLAGIRLHFEVELVGLRDASAEELSHGHVHGADGHGA